MPTPATFQTLFQIGLVPESVENALLRAHDVDPPGDRCD